MQWNDPGDHPEVYVKELPQGSGRIAQQRYYIKTHLGEFPVEKGDWIIENHEKRLRVVNQEYFAKHYSSLDKDENAIKLLLGLAQAIVDNPTETFTKEQVYTHFRNACYGYVKGSTEERSQQIKKLGFPDFHK
jgi:hypothetical protein